jgi:ATP-dependent exoDNAse (exonuclease V) beta subunit
VPRLTQIKASAGSGKTFELTGRFLRLLAQNSPGGRVRAACFSGNESGSGLNDILAVTFTNAAAQEMRDRVIRHLKLAALGQRQTIVPDMHPKTARTWVNEIVRDITALNIRTIDSLVHLIVRAAALDLNLPPDFKAVFSSEEALAPYLDTLIEHAAKGDKAMRKLLGKACAVIAVQSASGGFLAGEKLLKRLRDLFDAALAGDYDNLSAVEEISNRLEKIREDVAEAAQNMLATGEEYRLPWLAQALDAVERAAKGETDYSSKYLQKNTAAGLFRKNAALPPSAEAAFTSLREALAVRQEQVALKEALKLRPFVDLARTLALAFMSNLANEGNLPALLAPSLARKALHGKNGVPDALCRLGSRLRHFLLDEFQDTSREQWQTLRPLVRESLARGGTLTCVGDVKQSIYGWRGGEPDLFEAVFADPALTCLAPEAERRILPFNWRSRREIVAHNNALFSPLQEPETALRVMEAMLPPDTPPDILRASAGKVRDSFADCGQQTPDDRDRGFVLTEVIEADKMDELAEAVLTRLVDILRRDIAPRRILSDVLVLTRGNVQASSVAERLTREGIPVITENSLLLAAHPLIVQTVALLAFLDNPDDDIAFWTALTGSIVREHHEAGLAWEEAHNFTPAPGPLYKSFQKARPELWRVFFAPFHAQSNLMSPYDIVQEWFARLDVEARFPEARTFLRRFMEVLYSAEEKGLGDTASFLSHWRRTGGEEKVPMPENMDAVRVMTIHKSKGLEAPVVFLPWTNFTVGGEGKPAPLQAGGLHLAAPVRKSLGAPYYLACARQARENLHLLYVALTRAREELYFFRSSVRTREGKPSLTKGMDALWRAAGFVPPYKRGQRLETGANVTTRSDAPSTAPARQKTAEDWRPMNWLPRLKIFRTPLKKLEALEKQPVESPGLQQDWPDWA